MSTTVRCRANDPANCRFPGHQSHQNDPTQEIVVNMQQFFNKNLPSAPKKVPFADTPATLTRHAMRSTLLWKGVKPKWWNKFYEESASNANLPSQPELLDVIDSPVGKLAVVWQPESQDEVDARMTITSGISVSGCYYKSMETGETLGYIKMASVTEQSVEKSFGKDEFTPYRWKSRFGGSNFGFEAEPLEMKPYGERDLTGEDLIEKRREVWVYAQKKLGEGLKTPEGRRIYRVDITAEHLPGDETVAKDLKNFSRIINKDIEDKKEFYKTPYVDFSRVEDPLKGKGFGSALYVYTARRLAMNNQVLRSSGSQSDDAGKTWENFRKNLTGNVSSIELDYNGEKSTSLVLDFRTK